MTENPKKFFVGMPKNIFQGNPKRFSKKNFQKDFSKKFSKRIFQKDFPKGFFGSSNKFSGTLNKNFPKFGNKLVTKRVAKDIDPTRVKRIELTNKDKIRSYLEREAHFPQESPSFLQVLRKTILDYFLPFPPAPPLDDKRNVLPDHREK
tara:strand:+ start:641 stop:1087 length:447 start_codon:yes stop_codon:yes gene_type:complete